MKAIENMHKIGEKNMTTTPPPKSKRLQHSTNLTLDGLPTAAAACSLAPKKKPASSEKKEFSTLQGTVHNLNEVVGTRLCKMMDDTEKYMKVVNKVSDDDDHNDNELPKLSKKLERAKGARAFAKEIGDEDRMTEKLEFCFSLEKEIDEKLA